MLASTPERKTLRAMPPQAHLVLPPLSSLLAESTPYKTQLPLISSFSTPHTPRYAHPHPQLSVKTKSPEPAPRKRKASVPSPTRDFAFISHSPATYPTQEPAIDNASLARRKRRRTSPNELAVLNQEFLAGSTPNKLRRTEIAARVCMTEKAVQIWFQNKRQSLRRLRCASKEVTELPPTPDLSLADGADDSSAAVSTHTVLATPLKPSFSKSHLAHFGASPAMAQLSPIRSLSASNLREVLSPSDRDSLVLNLTNKKQPEFARQCAVASTQVMTFRLAPPKDRKPLAPVDHNARAKASKELQCVQNLLSLRSATH